MNKFAYVLLASIILLGCEKDGKTLYKINGVQLKTYNIDNCEYIGNIMWGSRDSLTHKGNCKFCAERAKNNCK